MHRFGNGWLLLMAALVALPVTAFAKKKKEPAPPAAGSAVRESTNEELIETATGDAFTRVDDAKPARFRLTGPAKFQVDFRQSLKAEERPTVVLSIFAEGKPVQSYRVPAKAGGGDWKNGLKASQATGFLLEVPAGAQVWEFRVKGATEHGGAILLVAADKARKPLAATSPVLKASVAVAAASPSTSPSPVPATSPLPAATPVASSASASGRSTPRSLAVEAGAVGYVRWSAKRFDPVAPGISVSVLRPMGPMGPGELAVGAAVGWRHHTGGRTFEEYRGRVLPPYIADVDAFPIEAVGRVTRPIGSVEALLQAGLGLEYARSSFTKADDVPRRWRENDWAPTASLAAGAERSLGGGKLGVRVGARLARHAFAAHDFEVLHGVESTIAWRRSF